MVKQSDSKFYRLWMENYLRTYVERDVRALFPQLNLEAYKRFIQMLAFLVVRYSMRVILHVH